MFLEIFLALATMGTIAAGVLTFCDVFFSLPKEAIALLSVQVPAWVMITCGLLYMRRFGVFLLANTIAAAFVLAALDVGMPAWIAVAIALTASAAIEIAGAKEDAGADCACPHGAMYQDYRRALEQLHRVGLILPEGTHSFRAPKPELDRFPPSLADLAELMRQYGGGPIASIVIKRTRDSAILQIAPFRSTVLQTGLPPVNGSFNPGHLRDAARYRWLRERDVDTIDKGGVFAGMTPENLVLSGDELDAAIDLQMSFEKTR